MKILLQKCLAITVQNHYWITSLEEKFYISLDIRLQVFGNIKSIQELNAQNPLQGRYRKFKAELLQ